MAKTFRSKIEPNPVESFISATSAPVSSEGVLYISREFKKVPKSKTITFRLQPELHQRIKERAEKSHMSMNEFFEMAMERVIDGMDKQDEENAAAE